MKHQFVALVAVAIILSACSAPATETTEPDPVVVTETSAPEPSVTPEPEPSETLSEATMEELFLITVRDGLEPSYPDIADIPDGDLIAIGKRACEVLDEGVKMEELYLVMLDEGVDPTFGGTIVGAGVAAFCPEYTDDL